MFSSVVRERLIDGLEGTPEVLEYLLEDLEPDDPKWDAHPDPARYSLRATLAHLADWDTIWLHRLCETAKGHEPALVPVFIHKRAEEQKYDTAEVKVSFDKLNKYRPQIVSLLRNLTGAQWKSIATHPEEGRQSIETQCAWILAHDDYYVKQVVRWLKRLRG